MSQRIAWKKWPSGILSLSHTLAESDLGNLMTATCLHLCLNSASKEWCFSYSQYAFLSITYYSEEKSSRAREERKTFSTTHCCTANQSQLKFSPGGNCNPFLSICLLYSPKYNSQAWLRKTSVLNLLTSIHTCTLWIYSLWSKTTADAPCPSLEDVREWMSGTRKWACKTHA